MALDLWTHQFCLACDRQVQVDDDAYCSEACRMADFEKTDSAPGSQASSPCFLGDYWSKASSSSSSSSSSSPSPRPTSNKFYLAPAYDFNNPQPYGTTPRPASPIGSDYGLPSEPSHSMTSGRYLTPSSSHSSLCSMQSTASTSEPGQLSDNIRKELRAYAVSFEQVRQQRRRTY